MFLLSWGFLVSCFLSLSHQTDTNFFPKTVRQVRQVLGVIQYYRDLWPKRSEILAPLTELVSTTNAAKKNSNKKIIWLEKHQIAFDKIKKAVAQEVTLAYPRFDKPFEVYTDASDIHLGGVIIQDKKPLAFFSRKLKKAQKNYTTCEKELLSVIEILKEFKNILFGYEINVHTDHKNLVHETLLMSSDRVMRWRILLEEYAPKFHYIKGEKNVVADEISRLPTSTPEEEEEENFNSECFSTNLETKFPMVFDVVRQEQQKEINKSKINRMKFRNTSMYTRKTIQGVELLLENNKIYVPKTLRKKVMDWYHYYLCHPGSTRLYKTLGLNITWPGMSSDCKYHVRTCEICQKYKKTHPKYGHLPAKIAEVNPWEVLCVDLVGPYTVSSIEGTESTLHAMTFIDPATGWFEISEISDKMSGTMFRKLDNVWLARYPRPKKIIFDNGKEFKKDFRHIFDDYGVVPRPTTVKNPQANSILERVHQVLTQMLRTQNINKLNISKKGPWSDVLASVAYAIRSTYHTTLEATPAQLIYGRDMIYPIKFIAEWDVIAKNKQQQIDKNNLKENSGRVSYDYKVGDKVLLIVTDLQRKLNCPTEGPFNIIQVHTNGNISIQRGSVIERVNIRRVKPFFT